MRAEPRYFTIRSSNRRLDKTAARYGIDSRSIARACSGRLGASARATSPANAIPIACQRFPAPNSSLAAPRRRSPFLTVEQPSAAGTTEESFSFVARLSPNALIQAKTASGKVAACVISLRSRVCLSQTRHPRVRERERRRPFLVTRSYAADGFETEVYGRKDGGVEMTCNELKRNRLLFRCLAAVALLLSLASTSYAQATAGTIRGYIADSTGAVIVGAEIRATNLATDHSVSAQTTEAGVYVLGNVPVGE